MIDEQDPYQAYRVTVKVVENFDPPTPTEDQDDTMRAPIVLPLVAEWWDTRQQYWLAPVLTIIRVKGAPHVTSVGLRLEVDQAAPVST